MSVAYFDRAGKKINRAMWEKHRADPAYKTVAEYDNGQVRVTLEWVGREANYGQVYADLHKLFVLNVCNYLDDGRLVMDPVERAKWFATEEKAVAFYQQFLTRWTDSTIDEYGEFAEADNLLTPEPPPDPNRPETVTDDDDVLGGVGIW